MLKLALLVLSLEAVAAEDTYTCDVADMRYLFARVKTVGKEIDNQVRDINTTVTTILDETNRRIDLLNSTLDAIRELLNNITKIIEMNECLSSPCKNGATCNDNVNNYTCTCTGGWTGTHCDNEMDECSSNPCENGATCVDGLDNYSCRCVAGYSGLNCQINIDECSSRPCMNGATCVDGLNNYSCRCAAGYSGLHCQIDIDECNSSPCKNGATCVDGLGSYSCRCKAGYKGFNCQTAECNGACTNVVNGFRLCDGNGVGVCNPMQGRLEVYYNNAWGTVCDDHWHPDFVDYSPINANVACRIFGYSSGNTRPEAFFGAGVGEIWLDDVQCVGTEQSLLDCYHNAWGSHNCDHNEDTGVVCKD